MFNRLRLLAVTAVALAMAGCGTIDRGAAQALAKNGASVAHGGSTLVRQSLDGVETYIEGQYLNAPLRGTAPPTEESLKNISSVSRSLAARAMVFDELFNAYGSFEALASYDAAGEVEGAIGDLNGSINEYAKAVGADKPPITDVAGKLTSIGGGFLAGQIQSEKLKQASELLRERLNVIKGLMEKEKPVLAAVREELIRGGGRTAIELWKNGVGVPSPILIQHLGSWGLVYDEKQAIGAIDKKRDQFNQAVEAVIKRRVTRQGQIQEETLQACIDSMSDLSDAHKRLELGEQPNLQNLTARISQLRKYVEELSKLGAKDKEQK